MKRRKNELCINPKCPSKTSSEQEKEIKKIEQNKIDRKCPKCGKTLVIRSSMYGKFLGCPGYPNCKHIEKITNVVTTTSSTPVANTNSLPIKANETTVTSRDLETPIKPKAAKKSAPKKKNAKQ
jgi:ssDNA-binding Zn-finger/Zn-ribbon topoisomerase 1